MDQSRFFDGFTIRLNRIHADTGVRTDEVRQEGQYL